MIITEGKVQMNKKKRKEEENLRRMLISTRNNLRRKRKSVYMCMAKKGLVGTYRKDASG